MIAKTHDYLVRELNSAENGGEKSAEFADTMLQTTLEAFRTENVRGEEGFERTDSILEGLGAGFSRYIIRNSSRPLRNYL